MPIDQIKTDINQAKCPECGGKNDITPPCSHPGCYSHVTHPCEGCGRLQGRCPNPGHQVPTNYRAMQVVDGLNYAYKAIEAEDNDAIGDAFEGTYTAMVELCAWEGIEPDLYNRGYNATTPTILEIIVWVGKIPENLVQNGAIWMGDAILGLIAIAKEHGVEL